MNEQGNPNPNPNCDHVIRGHKLCQVLTDTMMLINSTNDVFEIFHKVAKESCKALGCESARITMREDDKWVIRYVSNLPADLVGQSFTDAELPHETLAMSTRKPVAIDDAFHDDSTNNRLIKSLGIKSFIVLPLMEKNVVTGTLFFGYHLSTVSFTEAEIDYAGRMTTVVAIAIENARLYQDSEELKRLGDTLNEIESRLKEAEKLGKFGYFDYNVATRKLTWSEGVFQIFGRDLSLDEPTVEEFFELYSVDPGLEAMQELIGNNEISEFDAKITHDDLACIFHFSIRSINDDKGNCTTFFGTIQDISERKRVEVAMRESEERYRALFRDSPVMITTIDDDWTMLSVNPMCASQLGYTIDELEGQSILRLFRENDHFAVIKELQRCLQSPHQLNRWQIRKIRKDGELLWVEEIAQAIYGPNDALIIQVVCQDVSERKQVEEERERLLLQLESVLENINEGVVISDAKGNVLTMNKAALALHQYENIEQVRRPLSEYRDTFENFDLEGRPTPFEEWPTARVLRGEQFDDYEVRVRNRVTGKSWVASYSGTSVRSNSGDIVLTVITMRDISERKYAEEEIGRLNVGLKAWAAELDAANKDLEAFNYTVAHDLRNPLNIIFLSCQIIQEIYGEQTPVECLEYIQDIYDSVKRMNRLIDALLNFSRMGQIVPQREQVYLCKLAQDVANMLKKSDPARQVDFRIADGITANADANLVRVVLDNLLGNAWKYTGMLEKAVIEFGTTEIDGNLIYFVRDNGAGFEKTTADKLFIPFQRLPGVEEFKGSGIGLATVERIILRHGGRIWAEGEPGKGATFFFTLSSTQDLK